MDSFSLDTKLKKTSVQYTFGIAAVKSSKFKSDNSDKVLNRILLKWNHETNAKEEKYDNQVHDY